MPLIPPLVKIPIPSVEALQSMLADLVGRPVELEKGKTLRIPAPPGGKDLASKLCVATYLDARQRLGLVTICELGIAEAIGAALVLAPATALAGLDERMDFGDGLRDNYAEVCNVITQTLNAGHLARLKFEQLAVLPEELSPEVWELIASPGHRRDWTLTLEGYGRGGLTVVTR